MKRRKPFMLRRLKSQVETELLPKKEYLLTAIITDLQRDIYRSLVKKERLRSCIGYDERSF